jgi:stage II sporulation protein D
VAAAELISWQKENKLDSYSKAIGPLPYRICPDISLALFGLSILLSCSVFIISGCKRTPPADPTIQMAAQSEFLIRVLLQKDLKSCSLEFPSTFTVTDPNAQITNKLFKKHEGNVDVTISDGNLMVGGHCFSHEKLIISPNEPHIFAIEGNSYRGKLQLLLNAEGNSFDAINIVPLEPYLAGVIGAEMHSYWEHAALKAQAIAARTYCLFIKERFGRGRDWDVKRSQASQVYNGISAESARVWQAVNETRGMVLGHKSDTAPSDPDSERYRIPGANLSIFPTYYSSVCGGHTENSQHVFGGNYYEPLKGVKCDYCKLVAKPSQYSWKPVEFDKKFVAEKLMGKFSSLKDFGTIEKLVPRLQTNYGDFARLFSISLYGKDNKKDVVRAEDLRLTIDSTGKKIKSTIFKIEDAGNKWRFTSGRGFGHGVGMCQCGAQAMARKANDAEQILLYYYPNSKIVDLY